MNADGSDLRVARLWSAGGSASWPDWSPDGSKIAYTVVLGDTSAIHIVDADRSSNVRISAPSASRGDLRPHWSPDGKRIAFARSWFTAAVGNGAVSQAFVMDADGSNVTQITHDSQWAWYPVWSPDGTRLALMTRDLNGLGVINADGSGGRSLPVCRAYNESAASWRHAAAVAQ
jgi:TolB protein